ncbi:type II methionyl aminopeptidase [archaeon]|jgi:methionyl aminopeptidase|nr:type II methionyl aminopeptidase [archaeon]
MEKEKIIEAGKIASEIKQWIKPQIKKGTPLLEIAEKIENKIEELGAFPAFPVNLSINEQAAHYTPTHNDESLAHGLLKVDFGVQVEGYIADTAFSLDLENSEENKKLIEASRQALDNVEENISAEILLGDVGKIIEDTINSFGYNPVTNLSGHLMERFTLHAGVSVPNIDNKSDFELGEGLYAIEPFATNGGGKIHDGTKGNIYLWSEDKNIRSPLAREILEYIKDNFGSLPFASRWLVKEFGSKALLALRQLENEEIVHHYAILTEEKGTLVSQAENTFLIEEDKVIITTK